MSLGIGRPRRAPLFLIVCCLSLAPAAAQAAGNAAVLPREGGGAEGLLPASFAQADLQELVSIFDAAYVPGDHLTAARDQLALLERRAELDELPAFSFDERLYWSGNERPALEVDLGATLPLYRSISGPRAALMQHRLDALSDESLFARQEALTAFLRDLFSLALLRGLSSEADAALDRMYDTGWRAPADGADALLLPPAERELLALMRQVEQLEEFALEQGAVYERRIGTALGLDVPIPATPAFESLMAQLGGRPAALDRCLRASPLRRLAQARHDERLLDWGVATGLGFEVDLLGSLSYRAGRMDASVGIEARLPLPRAWPVAGQVAASAGSRMVEQSLRLSWPPPLDSRAFAGDPAAEAARALASELESLELELSGLLRAERQARVTVEDRELRLLWFTHDLHGTSLVDLAAARELALRPAADPVAELQAVQLRSELAFARLTHAEALLDIRLLCGEA